MSVGCDEGNFSSPRGVLFTAFRSLNAFSEQTIEKKPSATDHTRHKNNEKLT